MMRYAIHLEARDADGRHADVWAIAPSAAGALALIAAYRDESGFTPDEITRDEGPLPLPEPQAAAVGLDLAHDGSGLFCLMRRAN